MTTKAHTYSVYDKVSGKLLKDGLSLEEASRMTKICKPTCIQQAQLRRASRSRYIIRYSGDGIGETTTNFPVLITDTETGREKIFESVKEVAETFYISRASIYKAIQTGNCFMRRYKARPIKRRD